jgi:hypothetical protein
MSTCGYRIYPAWFGDDDPKRPMRELAEDTAARMGCTVLKVDTTGYGFDRRGGHFVDFDVTYSSTVTRKLKEMT